MSIPARLDILERSGKQDSQQCRMRLFTSVFFFFFQYIAFFGQALKKRIFKKIQKERIEAAEAGKYARHGEVKGP